jgi:hypothetical protein
MRKKKSPRLVQPLQPLQEQLPPTGGTALIVVELGAEWPATLASQATQRRVLSQLDGETPAAFAERLANGLDALFGRGRGAALETVALACNERIDAAADSARRKALGIALGAMAANKAGKAYLTAPPRSSGRLRHALAGLAQGLHDEWRTAGLEVSVDFADERATGSEAGPFTFTARVA